MRPPPLSAREEYTLSGGRIGAKSVNEGTLFKKYNFVALMLLCFGCLEFNSWLADLSQSHCPFFLPLNNACSDCLNSHLIFGLFYWLRCIM